MTPYYTGHGVRLYLGDMRRVLPELGERADLVVTDPPYEETKLGWDRWPVGWLAHAAAAADSMWCFLPLRQFTGPNGRGPEFHDAGWRLSQDVIWEKPNGTSFAADRFRRVHELAAHWYRGRWADIHHVTPTVPGKTRAMPTRRTVDPAHTGRIRPAVYQYGPTRLARTVQRVKGVHSRAVHPTEKPADLLRLLIGYGCPPGGTVLDPFAGSGSTGAAARTLGMSAILIEADERYCEAAAARLTAPEQIALL